MSCHTGNCKDARLRRLRKRFIPVSGGTGTAALLCAEPVSTEMRAAGAAEPVYPENGRDKAGNHAAAIAFAAAKGADTGGL